MTIAPRRKDLHESARQETQRLAPGTNESLEAMERRGVPQHPSSVAATSRSGRRATHSQRFPLRRRQAGPASSTALDRPDSAVDEAAEHRTARDLAWTLDGAARDRRRARVDRSGVGIAGLAFPAHWSQALPAGAGTS